jgi:hypothetical protein
MLTIPTIFILDIEVLENLVIACFAWEKNRCYFFSKKILCFKLFEGGHFIAQNYIFSNL